MWYSSRIERKLRDGAPFRGRRGGGTMGVKRRILAAAAVAGAAALLPWAVLHGRLWLIILGTALIGAVFFLGTEYILRRKLNLE